MTRIKKIFSKFDKISVLQLVTKRFIFINFPASNANVQNFFELTITVLTLFCCEITLHMRKTHLVKIANPNVLSYTKANVHSQRFGLVSGLESIFEKV